MLIQPFVLSVLLASLFLTLSIFLSRLTARALKVSETVPAVVIKPARTHPVDIFELILQSILWEVILPGFIYSLIFSFIPFSGIKAGLFVALLVFMLGSFPDMLWLATSVKLSLTFWLHQLLWRLLKLFLIFGTFGYFFN